VSGRLVQGSARNERGKKLEGKSEKLWKGGKKRIGGRKKLPYLHFEKGGREEGCEGGTL